MTRLYKALLERHYRRIAQLESKVPVEVAAELRVTFASETLHMVDVAARHGMRRRERRQLKRKLVNGIAS